MLTKEEGLSMQSVIDQAVEDLRRRQMLEATNEAFLVLGADNEAWQEETAERDLWCETLLDGVEPE